MQKTWETLTIQDNYIFCRVMETYPDLCKGLLEKILHMEIERIDFPEREKSIEVRHDSKGIRLDVFVKTPDGQKCFDMDYSEFGIIPSFSSQGALLLT